MEFDRGFLARLLIDDLAAMGFDLDDGNEVVEAFCEALKEYLPQLRSAVAAAEIQEVGFFAHALKGTFNNFSVPQFVCLAGLFENIEEEARGAGTFEIINTLMGQIESELKVCIK